MQTFLLLQTCWSGTEGAVFRCVQCCRVARNDQTLEKPSVCSSSSSILPPRYGRTLASRYRFVSPAFVVLSGEEAACPSRHPAVRGVQPARRLPLSLLRPERRRPLLPGDVRRNAGSCRHAPRGRAGTQTGAGSWRLSADEAPERRAHLRGKRPGKRAACEVRPGVLESRAAGFR